MYSLSTHRHSIDLHFTRFPLPSERSIKKKKFYWIAVPNELSNIQIYVNLYALCTWWRVRNACGSFLYFFLFPWLYFAGHRTSETFSYQCCRLPPVLKFDKIDWRICQLRFVKENDFETFIKLRRIPDYSPSIHDAHIFKVEYNAWSCQRFTQPWSVAGPLLGLSSVNSGLEGPINHLK